MHHELDFLPVGVRPLVGGVHQPAEQLLVVRDHVEVELPSANILVRYIVNIIITIIIIIIIFGTTMRIFCVVTISNISRHFGNLA